MQVLPNRKRATGWRPNLTAHVGLGLAVGLGVAVGAARAQETLPRPTPAAEAFPTPPSPERVFRLEREATLMERMAREAPLGQNPLQLRYRFEKPDYPPVPPTEYPERAWEPLPEIVEPAYLCYGRLYFEQINAERYGWDLGPLHPLISAGVFYKDVALLPYHAATEPLRRYECNAGYALPGDRMPLLLYLPEPSLSGALAEAGVIGLLFVMFP
jgi:hypothetical protein